MEGAKRTSWEERKHVPSKRSDVLNPIRHVLEKELIIPTDPIKPIINLGLGKLYTMI